eukprot:15455543-Alexandrium_andersonii.AAC.1
MSIEPHRSTEPSTTTETEPTEPSTSLAPLSGIRTWQGAQRCGPQSAQGPSGAAVRLDPQGRAKRCRPE